MPRRRTRSRRAESRFQVGTCAGCGRDREIVTLKRQHCSGCAGYRSRMASKLDKLGVPGINKYKENYITVPTRRFENIYETGEVQQCLRERRARERTQAIRERAAVQRRRRRRAA